MVLNQIKLTALLLIIKSNFIKCISDYYNNKSNIITTKAISLLINGLIYKLNLSLKKKICKIIKKQIIFNFFILDKS